MMNSEVIYYERQHFKQWSLWLLMGGINAIFITGCVKQLFLGHPFGNNPMSDTALIIVSASMFLLTALLFYMTLNTVINKEGIYVWFHPVQFRKKYFSWEEIERVYIRKYSPVREYGGWGNRIGFGGKSGSAYNMYGNIGLQIILKNSNKLLIGTSNPDGMTAILKKIGKLETD
ncbi:MAG: hypothetical protein LBL07_02520 [Tannerella sp.]|jgi:hypothetical protein|nr:hypothetical protein [Tannerella sp.]